MSEAKPIKDATLLRIATSFRDGLLDGQPSTWKCRVVSLPLQGYLSCVGIETKVIEGCLSFEDDDFDHVWLELPDGRILDPTADQFETPDGKEMPAVYLGELPEWYEVSQ